MYESPLEKYRRRVGAGMLGGFVALVGWWWTPGLPVWRAPSAPIEVRAAGLELFRHEWRPKDPLASGDGLGPVFNARSCVECHSQGGVGGGGDNSHNVMAFEAHPTVDRPEVKGGLIHKFAVADPFIEGTKALHQFFPVVKGGLRIESGCQVLTQDFDPVSTQSVNSTALFGAGWLDRISAKTIQQHGLIASTAKIRKELGGDFSGVLPGRVRILSDGRVGKFGWKAQFATLDEFVAAACANEIGLGNPRMEQARPMVKVNYPKVEADLTSQQFRELVAFVDTLPRPVETLPADAPGQELALRGKAVFREVGCAACHTPDVGGVEGVYTDFRLHRLDDPKLGGYRETPPVPLPEAYPLPEEWKTPALWGVADSAPYLHDGSAPTLEHAVSRHRGDAEPVYEAFGRLTHRDRGALFAFLSTLKAPTDAVPAAPPMSRLVMAR
ncbi:MAG: di-heme oxidoredictase family protein [Isosphaeraceae bacterium]